MDHLHIISKYAICYGIFFLILLLGKSERSNRLFDRKGTVSNPGMLLGVLTGGFLWLGVVPFFILHHSISEIVFGRRAPGMVQLCTLLVLLILAIATAITESDKLNTRKAVEEQISRLSKTYLLRYILYRIIFLVSYESFFRGYLLTDSMQLTGVVLAVVINISLYSALHILNDRREFAGCVVFGTILCCLCIWCEAAWPAILIHTVFSLVYELRSVKKNLHSLNKIRYENISYGGIGLHRK
jgi:membrane protease YdiL (CAAX protease family)